MVTAAPSRPLHVNEITGAVISSAMKVHSLLGYRLDLVVEHRVVVEVKSAEAIHPIHEAQLLSYLRLSGMRVGLLINFNVLHLRDGIKRMVDGDDWSK